MRKFTKILILFLGMLGNQSLKSQTQAKFLLVNEVNSLKASDLFKLFGKKLNSKSKWHNLKLQWNLFSGERQGKQNSILNSKQPFTEFMQEGGEMDLSGMSFPALSYSIKF